MMVAGRSFLVRALGVGLIACLLIGWCSLGGCCAVDRRDSKGIIPAAGEADKSDSDSPADASTIDLESKPLPRIPSGTIIGRSAPEGWSNLIMIAIPTLTREDLRDAPKIATHYARMFKFTLLARTEKSKAGYLLQTVARGFATTVGDKEIIVDSKKTHGADLGAFGARILAENEKHIDADLRRVARTTTMCLFDAQAVMRQGSDHVRMVLRHAIVVEPIKGTVYTFIWLLSKEDSTYALAEKEMQLIPEALREARYLSVKRNKFVLGLPTPEAFALVRTPQGKGIPWTPELEKLAANKEITREQVKKLEALLLAAGQAVSKK